MKPTSVDRCLGELLSHAQWMHSAATNLLKTILNCYIKIRIHHTASKQESSSINFRQKLSRLFIFSHI